MGIHNYFIKSFIQSDTIGKFNSLNEDITELIIEGFDKESDNLRKQNILIIFDSRRFSLIQSLARTIIKDTPPYKSSLYKLPNLEYEIENFFDYKYLIYLSRKVREGNDRIFKVLNIAHELQHVIQHIHFKDIFLKVGVVKGYFMAIKEYTNEFYRNIPIELDAFRKSKKITIILCGKHGVDEYISKKINDSQDDVERSYWEHIKLVDVQEEYDLRSIFEQIWDETESDIERKIKELKHVKQDRELDIDEMNFIEAYEFYHENSR